MYVNQEISLYDFVSSLSEALDLVCQNLNNHQKVVAHLACNIALEMNLTNNEIQNIVLAGMLHDIGAISLGERMKLLAFEQDKKEVKQHSLLGFRLLKDFEPLTYSAQMIRHHHAEYDPCRNDVPMGSYIIHLADRVHVLFDEKRDALEQIPEIIEIITLNRHIFHPDVFNAFLRVAKLEFVWFEALLPLYGTVMMKKIQFTKTIVDLHTLRNFAQIIARIIDFRSRFTASHSSGVAAVVQELAMIAGFTDRECKMAEIAGLMHDVGKLSVPNEILEKNCSLEKDEFNIIKKHTYYTFIVLSKVKGLEQIAAWAAYHHERQDGNGYPFHVKGKDFCGISRLMAAADVITALTEDRPYRSGMDRKKATEVLFNMAENGGIDIDIVRLIDRNFNRINNVRTLAQHEARKEYMAFNFIHPIHYPWRESTTPVFAAEKQRNYA